MSKKETHNANPTHSDESCSAHDETWKAFFSTPQWVLFSLSIIMGLLLRWIMLDARPYHHDESLHAAYGGYFYDWPNSNYYKYDPMLHGPMLYNCMRFIYAMFGDSLWAARTPVAILGSLFMSAPFIFRSFFGKTATLVLTAAIALSPTLIYWSRFLRNEAWVLSGMLITLYGFILAPRRLKALVVLFGITVQWCSKENIFVSLAITCGYLLFDLGYVLFMREKSVSLLGKVGRYIVSNVTLCVVSFIACFIIYAWFYGAGFRYPKGIIDGLGGRAIEYWAEHHGMERIKGPFNFHIYVTAWYEFPFFIAFLTHLVLFYKRATAQIQYIAAVVFVVMVGTTLSVSEESLKSFPLWTFFKLKNNLDVVGVFVLLFHAPLVTVQHRLRNERTLAATGYFFTATFFVYSYLGEKVPWLSVYPLAFGLPYLTLFFRDYFQGSSFNYKEYPLTKALLWIGIGSFILGAIFIGEQWGIEKERWSAENLSFVIFGAGLVAFAIIGMVGLNEHGPEKRLFGDIHLGKCLVVLSVLFLIRAAVQTNFLYAGKETEYLSQVHTTYEMAEYAKQMVDEAKYMRNGFQPRIHATGESTWPLTWYFRNIPDQYKFRIDDKSELKDFAYIFISWKKKHDPSEIPEGYIQKQINLRGWWVPDFKQISLKKFLRYSMNHYPWSGTGFSYATLLIAKDMERFRK